MRWVRRLFLIIVATVIIPASLLLPGLVFAQTASSSLSNSSSSNNPNAAVAATVQSYFADIPVMIAIAKCESGPRQFAKDGTALLGGNGAMVGVFQIDETVHTGIAASLGYDINTLQGNIGYARYLYGRDGTEPWISSFPCWGPVVASATTPAVTSVANITTTVSPLTLDLSLGSTNPQVLVLQQLLNKAGFTVAASGPGSPGNETAKFGAFTYAALKAFQCAKAIACSGGEVTTGYGYLNVQTRAALIAATATVTTSTVTTDPSISLAQSSSVETADASTTNITATANNPAEIAELQSRIAALVVIVQQLTAQLAARLGH